MCKRKPKPTISVELTADELYYIQMSVEYNITRRWDMTTNSRLEKLKAKAGNLLDELNQEK